MTITTYDDNKICQIALSGIAGGSIDSILEPETDLEATCANIYFILVETLLSEEWNWTSGEAELVKDLDVTPLRQFTNAFTLPGNLLSGPSAVFGNGSRLNDGDWCIKDNHLYCNYDTVIIEFRKKTPVNTWPPYFVNLVIKALQADLAMPVRENATLKATLLEEAYGPPIMQGRGGLFGKAKTMDAKSKPMRSLFANGDPLSRTRY